MAAPGYVEFTVYWEKRGVIYQTTAVAAAERFKSRKEAEEVRDELVKVRDVTRAWVSFTEYPA